MSKSIVINIKAIPDTGYISIMVPHNELHNLSEDINDVIDKYFKEAIFVLLNSHRPH